MKYSDKIILLGPFLGSWKEELITFRPFSRYIYETVDNNRIIVSSHYNRSFLYEWADDFIPIERQYSENENKQKGFIHKDINQKEYFKKVKQIKERICENNGYTKKNIVHYNIPYIQNTFSLSIYQKSFDPIKLEDKREPLVLFIPSSVEKEDKLEALYDRLSDKLDVSVIGDKKCYLQDKNLLNIVDYTDKGYKYLVEYINSAKLVITPCSHWTFLCNLQQVPVFSWGKFISPYKHNGLYSFGNDNMIVPTMENEKLVNQILFFYRKLYE